MQRSLHSALLLTALVVLSGSAQAASLGAPPLLPTWTVTDPGGLVEAPLEGIMVLHAVHEELGVSGWTADELADLVTVQVLAPSGVPVTGTVSFNPQRHALLWTADQPLAPASTYAVSAVFDTPDYGETTTVLFDWVTGTTATPPLDTPPAFSDIRFRVSCRDGCCSPRMTVRAITPPLTWIEARVDALGETVSVDSEVSLFRMTSDTVLPGFGTGLVCIILVAHSYVDGSTTSAEECIDPLGLVEGTPNQELCVVDDETGDIVRRRWLVRDLPERLDVHGGFVAELGFFDANEDIAGLPGEQIAVTVVDAAGAEVAGDWHINDAHQLLVWQADADLVAGADYEIELELADAKAGYVGLTERLSYTAVADSRALATRAPTQVTHGFDCPEEMCCTPTLVVAGISRLELGQLLWIDAPGSLATPVLGATFHATGSYRFEFGYPDLHVSEACYLVRAEDLMTGARTERVTCIPDPFAELRLPREDPVEKPIPAPGADFDAFQDQFFPEVVPDASEFCASSDSPPTQVSDGGCHGGGGSPTPLALVVLVLTFGFARPGRLRCTPDR